MKQLGDFTPDVRVAMKKSLLRNKRRRDEPCRHCQGTGWATIKTGTIACFCEKGQAIEREQAEREWHERVERECGIPRATQADVRRSAFRQEVLQSIRSSLEQSRGAYLYGSVGTGKSTAAGAALLESVQSTGSFLGSPGRLGRFITASDYLQSIRDSYDTREGGSTAQRNGEGFSDGASARVCVLDDVGVEYVTDWGAEQITRLVDHRVTSGLPTIYTSNLTLDELEAKYNRASPMMGSRVRSRIEGSCEIVHVDGPDYRRQR